MNIPELGEKEMLQPGGSEKLSGDGGVYVIFSPTRLCTKTEYVIVLDGKTSWVSSRHSRYIYGGFSSERQRHGEDAETEIAKAEIKIIVNMNNAETLPGLAWVIFRLPEVLV